MAYNEKDYKYYASNPKKISADLDEELLLALVDINSSWLGYMKPYDLDFVKKVIEVDPTTFEFVDRNILTISFLEEIISQYPFLIQYVYEPNEALIKLALSTDLNTIQYFTKLSDDLKIWVLNQNGMLLKYIPPSEQTETIVEVAIKQNIEAYENAAIKNLYLDKIVLNIDARRVDLISDYHPELIEYIVEYEPKMISKFIDDPVLTDEILYRTIEKNPQVFRFIKNPSYELIEFATKLDITLLDYLPYDKKLIESLIPTNGLALEYLRKKDLRNIKIAVEQNILALKFIPYPRAFLIDYAFKVDGIALQFIENPTDEQYLDAVQRNGYAIEFVPSDKQTKTIQTSALSSIGTKAIPFITEPYDNDIILEIITQEPGYIFKIDEPTDEQFITSFTLSGQLMLFYDGWEEKFSTEVKVAALTSDGSILEYFKTLTKTYIMAALESFAPALQWVERQDIEMAKAAIETDIRAIFFVDPTIMDEELLNLAYELDPDFFTRTEGELTFEQWTELIK